VVYVLHETLRGHGCKTFASKIDGNRIIANEIVGCDRGIQLSEATTHNSIEATLVHLCQNHVQIGDANDPQPNNNRIQAHLESERIADSAGVKLFSHDNYLDLTFGNMSQDGDVIFETTAQDNLVQGLRFPNGITNRATVPTNRVIANTLVNLPTEIPAVPVSGESATNRNPFPVEVRITSAGAVERWTELPHAGASITIRHGFHSGQTFTLNPGDRIELVHDTPPAWIWKGVG
jgi:hypothetical protein